MSLEVIPALDVSEGKLVRMSVGGPAAVREFEGVPLEAARSFVAAGARSLHVVDVDLAFSGTLGNVAVVEAIVDRFPRVLVQASGGVSARREIETYLGAGAGRVVLGSGALVDRGLLEGILDTFGERIVIGVETELGRIRPRGRDRAVDLDLAATVSWLGETACARLLHTSVRRVGELVGPDLDGLRKVMLARKPVIAAGGISSIDDLGRLADAGAEGAVVGRALYDGSLDPVEAFRTTSAG